MKIIGIEESDVNEFFDIMDDRLFNLIYYLEFMIKNNLMKSIIYWKIKLKIDCKIITVKKVNYYKKQLNQRLEKPNFYKRNKKFKIGYIKKKDSNQS